MKLCSKDQTSVCRFLAQDNLTASPLTYFPLKQIKDTSRQTVCTTPKEHVYKLPRNSKAKIVYLGSKDGKDAGTSGSRQLAVYTLKQSKREVEHVSSAIRANN